MKIQCFHSSSAGNLYAVSDGTTKIMIECGVDFREIQKCFNFGLSSLAGCLISHGHGDHAKSWQKVSAYTPVYMLKDTAEALGASGYNIKHYAPKTAFDVGTLKVLPFDTFHDVPSCGFYITSRETKEAVLFAIDTAVLRYTFGNVHYAMIECNYQREILNNAVDGGHLDSVGRNRIIRAHLGFDAMLEVIKGLNQNTLKEIHILHLSNRHADAGYVKTAVEQATGKPVYIAKG